MTTTYGNLLHYTIIGGQHGTASIYAYLLYSVLPCVLCLCHLQTLGDTTLLKLALIILTILATSCNFLPVGQVVYEKQQDNSWQVKYFIAPFDKGADQVDVDIVKERLNQNIK